MLCDKDSRLVVVRTESCGNNKEQLLLLGRSWLSGRSCLQDEGRKGFWLKEGAAQSQDE